MRLLLLPFFAIIITMLQCTSCTAPISESVAQPTATPKIIPNSIIQQIKNYTVGDESSASAILKNLRNIAQDSILDENFEHGRGLKTLFVDLDGDFSLEIVLEVYLLDDTYLLILQQQGKYWHLIFVESFWQKYGSSSFSILNSNSSHKLLLIKGMTASGTGLFAETLCFYKLIDHQIIPCLTLIDNMYITGWGKYWDQSYSNECEIENWSTKDELKTKYQYKFTPSHPFQAILPLDSFENIPYFENNGSLTYQWDSLLQEYVPQLEDSGLNQQQWETIRDFSTDSLIYEAFRPQIRLLLDKGTPTQQTLLRYAGDKMVEKYGIRKEE